MCMSNPFLQLDPASQAASVAQLVGGQSRAHDGLVPPEAAGIHVHRFFFR